MRTQPKIWRVRSAAGAWKSPFRGVDSVLSARRTTIFCPDEASSCGLEASLAGGLVREVVAEELCAAWTWGTVEAGREAAFVTYEAFAPLAATLLAQYAKMAHSRLPCGRPPFLVVLSGLGWANSPTHQNSDLAGTVLARPWPRMRLLCPLGAGSAARRLTQELNETRDGVAVVVSSKQPLLDLPDPGGPAVELRLAGSPPPQATVVAMGDVCVTEAVAAAASAAGAGLGLRVLAVIDAREIGRSAGQDGWPHDGRGPLVGVAWCAPHHVQPFLWGATGRVFPVLGYRERWGPTAWETLRANRMDRTSLLEELAREGLALPAEFLTARRTELDLRCREEALPGVPAFDPGPLCVAPWPPVHQPGLARTGSC